MCVLKKLITCSQRMWPISELESSHLQLWTSGLAEANPCTRGLLNYMSGNHLPLEWCDSSQKYPWEIPKDASS